MKTFSINSGGGSGGSGSGLTPEELAYVQNTPAYTKEPTGFTDPANIDVAYDKVARTVTLTGNVHALFKGQVVAALVSGWTSSAHDVADGTYFLYHNGTTFVWATAPWDFAEIPIAFISKGNITISLRETHGLMPWETHKEFHETVGTYASSGGDFSNYVLSSNVATERRPHISELTVADEDLPTVLAELATNLYAQFYLEGAGVPNINLEAAEVIPLATATRPYFNYFDGATWSQVVFPNNHYGKVFILAIPGTSDADMQKQRFLFIQAQSTSSNLAEAQNVTVNDLNLGGIEKALPEYVYIGEILIQYTSSNFKLVEVNKLSGTRVQNSTSAGYLSSVATDESLDGNGTVGNPLSVANWQAMVLPNAVTTNTITVSNIEDYTKGEGLKYKLAHVTHATNTSYNLYDIRLPSVATGLAYQVVIAGTTGSTAPTFPTTEGDTVIDGSVTWQAIELYQYAVISNIAGSVLTIRGIAFTSFPTELYRCNQVFIHEPIYQFDDGIWSAIGTDVGISDGNIPFELKTGKVVEMRTWCKTQDTGATKGKLKLMNEANHIYSGDVDGMPFTTETFETSATSIIAAYYKFGYNQIPRFDVSQVGSQLDTTTARIKLTQIII